MPDVPVNIMDQYRPEIHTDPKSPKYMERYAPMARRPTPREVWNSYHYARDLGLNFEAITHGKNTMRLRLGL